MLFFKKCSLLNPYFFLIAKPSSKSYFQINAIKALCTNPRQVSNFFGCEAQGKPQRAIAI
ncbi:MAG: hypothetical protein BRC42_06275 [Cyanobacteria bacterium QS_1_48_34]|nr:MAG: hypothetical protein BRC42_06275 [Cyanobacteria bacterium QS_1_48_34]